MRGRAFLFIHYSFKWFYIDPLIDRPQFIRQTPESYFVSGS